LQKKLLVKAVSNAPAGTSLVSQSHIVTIHDGTYP
jgi:hypothetical protein